MLPLRHKIDHGHPKVIIYTHIVDLGSQMLHLKFQDPRLLDSGEEDVKGVYHMLTWRPSW